MISKRNAAGASLLGQTAVILGLVFLFVCGALYTRHQSGSVTGNTVVVWLVVTVLFGAAVAGWWWLRPVRTPQAIRQWLWRRRWLWLLLVLSVLLRIPAWGTPPQDDGLEYYTDLFNACSNIRFDPSYLFENFRLANHPTWGMAMLAAIPEFFMRGNYNSFWVFHTLVALVAVAAAYDLLERDSGSRVTAFLGGLAVGSTPIFLGLTPHISVEPALGAFFLCLVWAYARQQWVLLVFTCALPAFSKELGIVLVAGFACGVCLTELLRQREPGFWKRVLAVLRQRGAQILLATCLVMAAFLLWYLLNPQWSWATRALEDSNGMLQFEFDPSYIVEKIQEYICTNFDWVLLVLCTVCLVVRRRGNYPPLPAYLGGIVVAIVFFQIVSVLAVTYTITRYNLAPELALCLLTVDVIVLTLQGRGRGVSLTCLAVLLTVQGYLTVDPLMKAVYPEIDTGAISMVRVKTDDHARHMSHYVIYNNQYSYLYKGLRKIFQTYSPEDHDIIVLGRDGFIYMQGYLWDMDRQDFAVQTDGNIMPISSYETGSSLPKALVAGELKAHAIILYSPTYVEQTPTPEEARAMIPDCYTNVQQWELSCGPAGKILYFTADLASVNPS